MPGYFGDNLSGRRYEYSTPICTPTWANTGGRRRTRTDTKWRTGQPGVARSKELQNLYSAVRICPSPSSYAFRAQEAGKWYKVAFPALRLIILTGLQWPGWRNGRRGGLKIRYLNGCVGSNPTLGTTAR